MIILNSLIQNRHNQFIAVDDVNKFKMIAACRWHTPYTIYISYFFFYTHFPVFPTTKLFLRMTVTVELRALVCNQITLLETIQKSW